MKILALCLFLIAICICLYIYKPFSHFAIKKVLARSGDKILALTFDDGPVPATEKLITMLDEIGIKATFFVIGDELSRRPEVIKKVFEKGHTIGSHSWDHPHMLGWRSKGFIQDQIEKTNAELKDIGITTRYMRAPFGETSFRLSTILKSYTMIHVHWTLSTKDWKLDYSPEKIHRFFSQIKHSEVLLMHDRAYEKPEQLQALKEELLRLKKEGFTFVPIDQLRF